MRSTRNCGRQSRSTATPSRLGRCWVITTAIESMNPRTALTGRPSGALIDDGTPKYERNHMLAPPSAPSADRERGGAGRSASPLIKPRGAGMRFILPAPFTARLGRQLGTSLAAMDVCRFDTAVYARRLAAAMAATADSGLDGLVITPGYDLRYLLGSRAQTFERLTALVLPASGGRPGVVPRRERGSLMGSR